MYTSRENYKHYLTQIFEIDSHAREFASWLYERNIKLSVIKDLLQSGDNKKILKQNKAYNDYRNFFYTDNKEDQKVWRRFIKRTYEFLMTTKRYKNQ